MGMVHLVCLECLEKWVPEVFLDQEDSMVSLAHLVSRDQRVLLVPRAMKDQLDLLDRQDLGESPDCQDCLGQMVCLGRTETLENLDQRVTRDHRVILVQLASQDPEESREILENEVSKEKKEKRERLV